MAFQPGHGGGQTRTCKGPTLIEIGSGHTRTTVIGYRGCLRRPGSLGDQPARIALMTAIGVTGRRSYADGAVLDALLRPGGYKSGAHGGVLTPRTARPQGCMVSAVTSV